MSAVSWFTEHVAGSAIAGFICAAGAAVVSRFGHRQVSAHLARQDEHLAEQDKALDALKGRRP